jgi:4-hydroxy-tetrahydrodipicolinate reductase
MISILLCGCNGRMGRAVTAAAAASEGAFQIIAGVDIRPDAESSFPVYASPFEFPGNADVIVDFSHHTALPTVLDYAQKTRTPAVIATTGHTDEERELLCRAADRIPVFFSRNMSLGINLLMELCRQAALTLGPAFDVEIVEQHHNQKLDAPSGTALMLADAIRDSSDSAPDTYVYDRQSVRRVRSQNEIGIHSIRGGSIVGEHEVIFAGANEVVSISHSAASREIFANGALRAAIYLAGKSAGLYSMTDLIEGK